MSNKKTELVQTKIENNEDFNPLEMGWKFMVLKNMNEEVKEEEEKE